LVSPRQKEAEQNPASLQSSRILFWQATNSKGSHCSASAMSAREISRQTNITTSADIAHFLNIGCRLRSDESANNAASRHSGANNIALLHRSPCRVIVAVFKHKLDLVCGGKGNAANADIKPRRSIEIGVVSAVAVIGAIIVAACKLS
jgi:hypothetical protein